MNKEQEKLWESILTGDRDALARLIQELEPLIKSESKVNGMQSEDVAQDVRERLVQEILKRIPPNSSCE